MGDDSGLMVTVHSCRANCSTCATATSHHWEARGVDAEPVWRALTRNGWLTAVWKTCSSTTTQAGHLSTTLRFTATMKPSRLCWLAYLSWSTCLPVIASESLHWCSLPWATSWRLSACCCNTEPTSPLLIGLLFIELKTETCKLYSRVFWIFLPNIIKFDLYILLSYIASKLVHFWDTV